MRPKDHSPSSEVSLLLADSSSIVFASLCFNSTSISFSNSLEYCWNSLNCSRSRSCDYIDEMVKSKILRSLTIILIIFVCFVICIEHIIIAKTLEKIANSNDGNISGHL
ncbi:hypothetical protein Mgra_00006442 [Meloidogyne graminicola]|uniref:Uncharacterized protein n=1 Tax=Meloidogyne graminicola TaxID=189291 RepID=A0A8S9ZL87_9BILA|nr:hypothetical protein Mgra_00006442 [Meloidogyne graminicola]